MKLQICRVVIMSLVLDTEMADFQLSEFQKKKLLRVFTTFFGMNVKIFILLSLLRALLFSGDY